MCRCGERGCGLCQAKWAAPAVLRAHRRGVATVPIDVCVADPTVVQTGRQLQSRLSAALGAARRGGVELASLDAAIAAALRTHVVVHCPDLDVRGGRVVVRQRGLEDALRRAGFRGMRLATIYAADGGAAELDALLKTDRACVVDGTDVAFSRDCARPRTGVGPVFFSLR